MNYVQLEYTDLALASLLVLANAGLSLVLNLGLARRMLLATLRMVVQLSLVGLVLKSLFAVASPWLTGLVAVTMILFAGREIMARQERRFDGLWSYSLGTGSMLFALTGPVRPDPWFDPRYALPLLGMILGNTMTGISLGLHTLTTGLVRDRAGVEAQLALGHSRNEAFRPIVQAALTSALMPIVNSMAATGLVSLPGMMTGQILAGVDPAEAVKYQILIMFLIAGGTSLGAVVAVLGGAWRLSDQRHRLRLDRLK